MNGGANSHLEELQLLQFKRRLTAAVDTPQKQASRDDETHLNLNGDHDDDDDDDTISSRTPLKKKANFVLPEEEQEDRKEHKQKDISQSYDHEEHHWNNDDTLTRFNNLAHRIKDKISAVPHAYHKRPREYKLRAFVGVLFLVITLLVTFAHIFYYQELLKKAYLDRIRFAEEERLMRVYDDMGLEVIRGYMGDTYRMGKAYDCHEKNRPSNATLCLEWMYQGRLSLSPFEMDDQSRCYRILWESLSPDVHPTDCYDMKGQSWYGAGALLGRYYHNAAWPLNKAEVAMTPFVAGSEMRGNNGWGSVLRRLFFSSKATAITVDDDVPLWVSINANQSQRLCIQARGNKFPYWSPVRGGEAVSGDVRDVGSEPVYSVLNYTICTAKDLLTLKTSLADTNMWDGLKQGEMDVIKELMEDPVWRFQPKANDYNAVDSLMKFTNDIVGVVWTSPGYLVIDAPWEEHAGDFDFDSKRFQGVKEALDIIHRKGFKVAVTVRPFVSTFSRSYKEGLDVAVGGCKLRDRGAWIVQQQQQQQQPGSSNGQGSPALTSFHGDNSLALADLTCANVSDWMSQRLAQLVKRYDMDGVLLESATVDHLPRYYTTHRPMRDPSELDRLWVQAVRRATNVISVNSASQMPRLPTFTAVPWLPATWDGLATLLPLVLTLSMSGYPFLIPPPIGGFVNSASSSNPERELYIRWLQLNTFLPVVQFATLPSVYDSEVETMASNLTRLRKVTVLPLLQRYGSESVINGLPIIRPLWMLDPFDKEAIDVHDEFCVGDELLIAPILDHHRREREVYLPKGVWKDGIDGSLRKGGRWIHHHKATLEQIAYFVRMPDGTRW